MMDEAMLQRVATLAAEEAVKKTFLGLGVDISTPEKVIEAQDMFRGLRNFQGELKAFKTRFWATVGSIVATALGGLLYGYVQGLQRHPPI